MTEGFRYGDSKLKQMWSYEDELLYLVFRVGNFGVVQANDCRHRHFNE